MKKLTSWLIFLGLLMGMSSFALQAKEISFLQQLKQNYLEEGKKADEKLSPSHLFLQELLKQGSATRTGTDKEMRAIFLPLQALMEQEMIKSLSAAQPAKLSAFSENIRSIWIIHAALMATPLVTEGQLSEKLVSPAVLADPNKERIQTSLKRAALMRAYLAQGGILITAYPADKRAGPHGRTPEQIAIFEKLKKQYPQQLIEFPIPVDALPQGQYPPEKIGATYIMQEPSGHVFELTNQGTQIADAPDGVKWSVWLQERHLPDPKTTQRLCQMMHFLEKAGLQEVIQQHAVQYGQNPQAYFVLLAPYLANQKNQAFAGKLLCAQESVRENGVTH